MRHRTQPDVAAIDRQLTRCAEQLGRTRDPATYANVWAEINHLLDQRLTASR